jgi:FtsP/CotA-like multicopper oxidase with cupredoxin domain
MRTHLLRRAALAAALLTLPPSLAAQDWTRYTAPNTVEASSHHLSTRLTAAPGRVQLDGVDYATNLFDDQLTPPLLRLQPGDSLTLMLVNRMAAGANGWTNLHYHGFAVSPVPPADNVTMIHVAPGDSFHYRMRIPGNHQQGLFWYHPHPHGVSAGQVGGGMAGLVSIGDPRAGFAPEVRAAPEFFLMLKQFQPTAPSASIPLVNGARRVQLPDVPVGGRQFWRIANTAANQYFSLRVVGPDGRNARFQTIARDGNPVPVGAPVMEDSMLMGPGQRAEIVVHAAAPGSYELRSVEFAGAPGVGALVRVNAVPRADDEGLAPRRLAASELRGGDAREGAAIRALLSPPDAVIYDSVTFGPGNTIDGVAYTVDGAPKRLVLGRTYEWKIKNPDPRWHLFHIHQNDFLVLAIGNRRMPANYRLDTVNVPPNGFSIIRFTYERPETVGPFVLHCHILAHEDRGMMANVDLSLPPTAAAAPAPAAAAPAARAHSH